MRRVVVQPDAFQDIHLAPMGRFDVQAGTASVFGRGDTKRRWIGTEDAAALVAAVTLEADPPDTVTIGGPEAISRNEAVAIAETLTGNDQDSILEFSRPSRSAVRQAVQKPRKISPVDVAPPPPSPVPCDSPLCVRLPAEGIPPTFCRPPPL